MALSLPTAALSQDSGGVRVLLPEAVSLVVPDGWTALSDSARIALDRHVMQQLDISNKSVLSFIAVRVTASRELVGSLFVRFYPEATATQADAAALSAEEVTQLDARFRGDLLPTIQQAGLTGVEWIGTKLLTVGPLIAVVTEYRHANRSGTGRVHVRLLRFYRGARSFNATISYDESYPDVAIIADGIIASIRAAT